MRILQIHCQYRSGLSGEDTVFEEERRLLMSRGHCVDRFVVRNSDLRTDRMLPAINTGLRSIWNQRAYRELEAKIGEGRPDVAHVHNTFAALSPSVFWALHRADVPVVHTLHNFRLTCANSSLLRGGVPCEECVGRWPAPAIRHGCLYGGSRAAGTSIALTQAVHFRLGTYSRAISAFIAFTEFARSILIRAGLPPPRIHVKPNFVAPAQSAPALLDDRPRQIIFVGSIDRVKGIDLLLAAWAAQTPRDWRLHVVGEGPDQGSLQETYRSLPNVVWHGRLTRERTVAEVSRSRWLVLPSRWYEGFPMAVVEALSAGTPVVVPSQGSFPSIVEDGHEALMFVPNQTDALRAVLDRAMGLGSDDWSAHSKRALQRYQERYTPELNYSRLMEIYRLAQEVRLA